MTTKNELGLADPYLVVKKIQTVCIIGQDRLNGTASSLTSFEDVCGDLSIQAIFLPRWSPKWIAVEPQACITFRPSFLSCLLHQELN